ncbi:hypothetical protein AC244_23360 [Ensifer adhaerens]|uniref:Uncharacterized protein n=1 Tax=Ensifer adhaerens TaxID=106592 RepID=A0A0L8BLK5_ENSAD|nr:hypothetical protein AC244_23360 [Ensifer adhaerens]
MPGFAGPPMFIFLVFGRVDRVPPAKPRGGSKPARHRIGSECSTNDAMASPTAPRVKYDAQRTL